MNNEIYEKNIIEFEQILRGKQLYLFGAGNTCAEFLKDFLFCDEVEAIFDNDLSKINKHIGAVVIKNSCEINMLDPNKSVFLITTYYANEIKNQLENLGIKFIFHFYFLGFNQQGLIFHPNIEKNDLCKIKSVKKLLVDKKSKQLIDKIIKLRKEANPFFGYGYDYNPFFGNEILNFSTEEIAVDGGAFKGDTITRFKKNTENEFKKIYAFEPDEKNFLCLVKFCGNDNRIECVNAGLWSTRGKLSFVDSNDVAAHLAENGESLVNVESIDEFIKEKVTFIKMDIEGAELKALIGAKSTILNNRPKLAISIYHNCDDLWEIPLWIKQMVPEYKLYVRHHSYACDDTVLYATI